VPDDLEGSLDRLAAFNRRSAKTHSGIYRDLAVRKRKTEIDEMLRDVSGPIFDKVAELIHDIEEGRRVNEVANLDELAAFVTARSAA
jgi:2-dehydropantoate 2-reductase